MPTRVQRWLLPEALLVVGLSLLAAWILRSIAPPSLIRDGERLPVGLSTQHGQQAAHHGAAGAGAQPSPVSDEPLPHFFGTMFLAAHLLAVVLAVGIPLIRRTFARLRLQHANFAAQLVLATLAALAAGVAAVLAARFGYGDRLALRAAFAGGVEVARYAFVAALAVVVLFSFPLGDTGSRAGPLTAPRSPT